MENKQYILTLYCPDQTGIVAAATGSLAAMGLFILELSQFSDPSTGQFFMRIFFETQGKNLDEGEIALKFEEIASKFDMTWQLHNKEYRPKVLIMVSHLGHCLNDLLHRHSAKILPIDIPAVVSNHTELREMCKRYNIPFHHLPITKENKEVQEKKLLDLSLELKVDSIVLARYMQILSKDLCERLSGKIINIHHSFLPSFKGAKPYHQAYDRGVKIIGATAHYVTADLDEGPIIAQEITPVNHSHSPNDLVQIGCDIECLVLSRALKWHIEQRVLINDKKTVVFN